MKNSLIVKLLFTTFLLLRIPASAVEDLRISIQSTNVILSWPSAPYERFLVQWRPDLQPETPWIILTNSMPGEAGTNRTRFVHPGGFVLPVPCLGGTNGGGSQIPPPMLTVSGITGSVLASSEPTATSTRMAQPRSPVTARKTKLAVLDLPPLPPPLWPTLSPMDAVTQNGLSDCGTSAGFYQVFLIPDFWYDYEGQTLTEGQDFLPVYFDVDPEMIVSARVLVNGAESENTLWDQVLFNFGTQAAPDVRLANGVWLFHDRMTNGTYQIALRTTLQLSPDLSDATPYISLTAPPVTATISNLVSFAAWNALLIGTGTVFQARSAIAPANWQIDLHDQHGGLVRTATGYTADGAISWAWDLTDNIRNPRTDMASDGYFDPQVTVMPVGVGQTGTGQTKPAPLTVLDYPSQGGWVIAYQDKDQFDPKVSEAISNAVYGLGGGPGQHGIASTFVLLRYETNVSSNPTNAQTIRETSWRYLEGLLFNQVNRNFYINAHGSEKSMGGDCDLIVSNKTVGSRYTPRSRSGIRSDWIRENITRNKSQGQRPFRFVFLDGCATATGDWPDAFGIAHATNALSYYQNIGRRPRTRPSAYVGWAEPISYSTPLYANVNGWGDYVKYANFRTAWMFNWANGPGSQTLSAALLNAQSTSGWINEATYRRVIRIYGYGDLRFNEYNRREDWPTK